MPDYDWTPFCNAVRGQGPRETLVQTLDLFESDSCGTGVPPVHQPLAEMHRRDTCATIPIRLTRLAVDLGCGTGRDSIELLRHGWRVLAIDREAAALEELRENATAQGLPLDRLQTQAADFKHATWPKCDLLYASRSLPFCEPDHFPTLWRKIVDGLKNGGRFGGQFFGIDDEWNVQASRQAAAGYPPARVFHTRAEVEALLAPFHIEHLEEVNRPGKTSTGETKHWHIFHVIARKQ